MRQRYLLKSWRVSVRVTNDCHMLNLIFVTKFRGSTGLQALLITLSFASPLIFLSRYCRLKKSFVVHKQAEFLNVYVVLST